MSCADDPSPLPEQLIAERAARLCQAAEAASGNAPNAPSYVIGTEVPVPGGAAEDLEELQVTTPDAALNTIELHRKLFADTGLSGVWDRVIATVVQPGVEFDHDKVVDYEPNKARALSAAIEPVEHIVFEAHSTDYQTADSLAALVRDHFAILKVGPGLTFAMREALWSLDSIERELLPPERRANLRQVAVARMRANPQHWAKYYERRRRRARPAAAIQLERPDPLLLARSGDRRRAGQAVREPAGNRAARWRWSANIFPTAYAAYRDGRATLDPADLVIAQISATLDAYYGACNPNV